MRERLNELEQKLEKECSKYEDDCSTCPCKTECDEYAEIYKKRFIKFVQDNIKIIGGRKNERN